MKKEQKLKLLVILGPTASGKSDLAIKIARKFNGEIVSADSRQIYRGMDIGTAKPTKKELSKIKHHLIDIRKPKENYSVGEYKKDATKAINKIIKRGKLPILTGGTGLYISAIVNNWEIPEIKENKKLREKLQKEIDKKGLNFVFKKLVSIDPESAYIVDPKNPQRVIRALEIALLSGKKFSEQRKTGKPLYDVLEIGLNPPAKILNGRISKRIRQMVKTGFVDEVKKLVKKYGYKCKAFDAIDYREIIYYLKEKISLKEATEQINKNTWHYAKRQMTWFRKYNPKARWVKNQSEAEKLVRKFIN
jgi:tRNA dimethylallyltransferase